MNTPRSGETVNEYEGVNIEQYFVHTVLTQFYAYSKVYTLAKKYFFIRLSQIVKRDVLINMSKINM